jgi:hypothetical protein
VATAATPYVIRPIRIGMWIAAGAVGLAGIYLTEGLPGDALGGVVLGFAV